MSVGAPFMGTTAEVAIVKKLRAHLHNASEGADAYHVGAVVTIGAETLPVRHDAHFLAENKLGCVARAAQTHEKKCALHDTGAVDSASPRQMTRLHAQQIIRQTLDLDHALNALHVVYVGPGQCP